MLDRIMAHAEGVFAATSPEAASVAFMDSARPLGATYLQTRVYLRPDGPLTSARHFAAGGLVTRIAPAGWAGSEEFDYVCFSCNPLLQPIREGRTRYRFSEFAPRGERRFGRYWEALGEAQIGDAICATSYGKDGRIASLHLGFADGGPQGEEASALQMAGLLLTERLMDMIDPIPAANAGLTERELDSLALVAEGKTDWEISVILGVSEATARFHVDNGRRKLGAVNRAQAVARLAARRMI